MWPTVADHDAEEVAAGLEAGHITVAAAADLLEHSHAEAVAG